MYPKDLSRILEEIPILLVDGIFWHDKKYIYKSKAVAISRKRKDGSLLRYTILNYTCDNLAQNLLHESIHHICSEYHDTTVEALTDYFWDELNYRKICQNKIVELLGRMNL